MRAKVIVDTYLDVLTFHPDVEGDAILEVACSGYAEFRRLPALVEFKFCTFGKTGWNSDTGRACYKASEALRVRARKVT